MKGVKLRDLGVTVRTSPPVEEHLKGCRGLQVTVAADIDTKDRLGKGALCGSLLPQRTTCLA